MNFVISQNSHVLLFNLYEGTCSASGDPHVMTFDGVNTDVYGVGLYTFAQVRVILSIK